MRSRGQMSIEFLIILVVMLLIFTNVSMDIIDTSLQDAEAFQLEELISAANITVNGAARQLLLQGIGAKRTVNLRAPPQCGYAITGSSVKTASCDDSSYDGIQIGPSSSYVLYGPASTIESGELGTLKIQRQ
jgi:uncharacterized protein (UPF0333 family)